MIIEKWRDSERFRTVPEVSETVYYCERKLDSFIDDPFAFECAMQIFTKLIKVAEGVRIAFEHHYVLQYKECLEELLAEAKELLRQSEKLAVAEEAIKHIEPLLDLSFETYEIQDWS